MQNLPLPSSPSLSVHILFTVWFQFELPAHIVKYAQVHLICMWPNHKCAHDIMYCQLLLDKENTRMALAPRRKQIKIGLEFQQKLHNIPGVQDEMLCSKNLPCRLYILKLLPPEWNTTMQNPWRSCLLSKHMQILYCYYKLQACMTGVTTRMCTEWDCTMCTPYLHNFDQLNKSRADVMHNAMQ